MMINGMLRIPFLFILVLYTICGCQAVTNEQNNTAMDSVHTKNPYYSHTDTSKLKLSDEEWKKVLSPEVYAIARNKGTERAFTGKYWDYEGRGTYYCAACGNALFKSDAKFASSCGWPSYYEAIRPNSVNYVPDRSFGMERTEVICGRCEGHLGHIFDDGPPPTFKRFCMNSQVLDFEPEKL
jgi:peptide-methionine (R)-S-oxide reductase